VKRLAIAGATGIVGAVCCTAASILLEGCTSATSQATDHFDGQRFHNRQPVPEPTFWEEVRIAWILRTKATNWPARFDSRPADVSSEPVLHGIRVVWVGHAGVLIQTPTLNIITDPVLLDSIGPRLFPTKTVTNPGVTIADLPRIDVILISHNHFDHLDLDSLHAIFNRQRSDPPRVLAGLGVGGLLAKEGLSSYSELDWDQSVTVRNATFYFLEAVHTSRRGISDTNKTLWGSFLIDSPEGKIYFAGDTAYGEHFKQIYERFGPPKVSLLPIGAYEPRWFMYRMHMNPDEAVRAHMDLHSEHSIAIHFGLLDMAAESYEAPVNELAAARMAHGIEEATFVAPYIGQVFQY
jgi:L-ascorbate metabolism protein UlaG (beta-lactamase superfamily)